MRLNNYLGLALFSAASLIGQSSMAQHEHDFVNGICTVEGCAVPDKYELPAIADDGFYELRNAGNVEWFGWNVAQGNIAACGRMMNDIDFEGKENLHSPIGPDAGHKFNGTWDGQGHRITNMILNLPDKEGVGFFGMLRGNGPDVTIKNTVIDRTCSVTGKHRVGAFAGWTQNTGNTLRMENLVNEADVTAVGGSDAGAIVGGRYNGAAPRWSIRNCVNTGKISANGYAAAVAGWMGDNAGNVVENFVNLGVIEGFNGESNIVRTGGFAANVRNIFDLSGTPGAVQGVVEELTAEDAANGRLAYLLNGDQSVINFCQNIGEDEYPVPFATHKRVYFDGSIRCDGTPLTGTYTNTPATPVIDSHRFADGDFYCQTCGQVNPDFCGQTDGVYQLTSVRDVEWFSVMVNSGHTGIDAYLTRDLDMTGAAGFAPIGTRACAYKGTFDGGFHTVSNLDLSAFAESEWVGFFGHINGGATIRNLRLDETCYLAGKNGVALVGGSSLAGDIHLANLGFEGNAETATGGGGGIIGSNTGSAAKIYMDNCYSTGTIIGQKECGALSGWLGSNSPVVRNCWSTATVTAYENESKYMFRHSNGVADNCYCTYGAQGNIIEFDDVESGSLCYKLNGDQSSIAWTQNLGEDAAPTFMPGHKQVYPGKELDCDGSYDATEMTFTNEDGHGGLKPHEYADGFCKNCNHENPDYPFIKAFANADNDTTGGYLTSNSGDGSGLAINNSVAEHWNMRWFDTYQQVTGLPAGVYKLRVQGLQRVCQWDNNGREYGEGTLNDEYAPLYHSSQYYALAGGRKVAATFMDIAEGGQEESTGETENFNDYTARYVPNSLAACRKYFAKGLYWNAPLYFYVESENDTVNIGVENSMYEYGNWTVWDTWRLEYAGDGDEAYQLIRAQQTGNIPDLSSLDAKASYMEAFENAKDQMDNAATIDDILAAADVLSTCPMLIRKSHLAYQAYDAAVKAVMEERAKYDNLNGHYTDLLDTYLEGSEESVEGLPHGTYLYIMEEKPLDDAQLTEEAAFVQELFKLAVKNSVSEGADISNLIVNAGFDEDSNFKGWTETHTALSSAGSNFSSNTGFTDIYPVAGTWNTSFDVYQDMEEGLPDGVYMLEAPAFFRPGGNGMGEYDGSDFVTASLYLNDFATPVMNIYKGQIPYADAINGINCRYDAVNDDNAPHNGEKTSAQDFDTGEGYVPEEREAVSFAFAGGRYTNQAYGIVTGGKLRIGIRNTGKPYYSNEMTMWGRFKLKYMGKNEEALDRMIDNLESYKDAFVHVQTQMDPYLFSMSHIAAIEESINKARTAADVESKMAAVVEVKDEINAIAGSNAIYEKLKELTDWCYVQGDSYIATDPARYEALISLGEEMEDIVYSGSLTDEEALAYYEAVLDNESIGGGVYVQGDLLDAEGNNVAYADITTLYPLHKNADGKYTGRVKLQDRTNLPNTQNRAGVYFSRLGVRYKCPDATRRFFTPARGEMTVTSDGGNDFQALGGEFDVTLDLDNMIVDFKAVDYPWNDDVFVVGSILDDKGEDHRWKNDEMRPLHHQGDGVYEGDVTFFKDYKHEAEGDFLTFTIFACRATTGLHEYTKTSTRSGWTESRYGSDTNALVVEDGVPVTGLIRGSDRQWWMAWDNETDFVKYHIVFDMNNGSVVIAKDKQDYEDGIHSTTGKTAVDDNAVYNLNGQRVAHPTKGIYIVGGKKVMFK